MNLAQIRTAIQALGYGTDTVAQQNLFINTTYHEVYAGDRWPFLEKQANAYFLTLGNGVFDYVGAGTTDLIEFDSVRLAPGIGCLENIEPQDMRDLETSSSATELGQPAKWSQIAGMLHVWPAPDQAYQLYIDYIYAPPDLVADADTPVIPVEFHDVLVYGAAKMIALRERDIWGSELLDNEFQNKLRKMRQAYLLRQRQTSSRVKKSGGVVGSAHVLMVVS